ncbi:MAG: mobile mystery protein B [Gemmatimonadota bacterium]
MDGEPEGATPLDPEEAVGLLPAHITTRAELNAWEQANLLHAEPWAFGRRHPEILSLAFMKRLHRKMFGVTWKWAGAFRQTDRTIGVLWQDVQVAVLTLCRDVNFWIEHHTYDADELAARFHQRLTQIHPFPNGNGRHARWMTDLLRLETGHPRCSWGRQDLTSPSDVRSRYIAALRAADDGDLTPLLEFLRT